MNPAPWLMISSLLYASCAQGDTPPGLCTASETVYFSCVTARAASVNVCGGPKSALQYRFGHNGKTELKYPEDPVKAGESLHYSQYMRSQVDRVELRFENSDTEYVVYDYREMASRKAGVRVVTGKGNGKEQDLSCSGPVTSRLRELATSLPCDADSALNGDRCQR